MKDNNDIYSRVRPTAEITVTVILTVIVASSVLYFIYVTRAIFLDFIFALVLAAALAPVVAYLERHRFNRIWASVVSLVGAVVLFSAVLGSVATPLFTQGIRLIENAPQIVSNITSNPELAILNQKYQLTQKAKTLSNASLAGLTSSGSSAIIFAGVVVDSISSVVIALIFTFFLLVDGPKAWKRLLHFLKDEEAARINGVGIKMLRAINGFVSGNLFISLIAGSVTLILLLILRVPYAFALAALVALFDLIPMIGAALATIIVALVALTKGLLIAVIVIIVLLFYQFVEGHFIQPAVYSRSVALSALIIIVASVVGAELMGITGVLLAIPAAAVIQILVVEFVMTKKPTSLS
jgi:predicted PurR-regulated permease PerM